MKTLFISYDGFAPAILGAMLSYGKTNFETFEDLAQNPAYVLPPELRERIKPLSLQLATSGPGHDKFLEQIQYWMTLRAPLFWWKQFDTYRIGVSKSSESTMHRSWKNGLQQSDFAEPIFAESLSRLNCLIKDFQNAQAAGAEKLELAKHLERQILVNLPDSYLQTRLVNVNAKTLRNIYFQRRSHKLREWHEFCDFIKTLPHADLITAEPTDAHS